MNSSTPGGPARPDTKDWTWVTHRRCAECGFDPGPLRPADYPATVLDLAGAFQTALARPDAGQRPDPGTWSTVEYARHVADVCEVMSARLDAILAAEGVAEFASWDGEVAAVEEKYGLSTAEEAAALLRQRAESASRTFARPEGDQWMLRGLRGDGAPFTAASLGLYLLHELAHHAHDVA